MFNCERLERRQMLAVTSYRVGETLTVLGDSNANDIRIDQFGSTIIVTSNYGRNGGGVQTIASIAASSITRIDVFAGDGNDKARVSGVVKETLYVHGGRGADRIEGGGGMNALFGHGNFGAGAHGTSTDDAAADTLIGGIGTNYLYGQKGNDTIFSCTAPGLIGTGSEFMFGGDGNDTFHVNGRGGQAFVFGDAGNDTLRPAQDRSCQKSTFAGGSGFDTLDFSAWWEDVACWPGSGKSGFRDFPDYSNLPHQTQGDVEAFAGGSGDDRFYGGTGTLILAGAGNDEVESFGIGSSGVTVVLGAGNDRCRLSGAGTVLGGAGDDHITGSSGNDVLYGEAGNDVVHGQDGDDFVHGGAGNDLLYGGNHSDRIDARDGVFGNDRIDNGNDVVGTDTAWIDFSFDEGYDDFEGIEVLHLN